MLYGVHLALAGLNSFADTKCIYKSNNKNNHCNFVGLYLKHLPESIESKKIKSCSNCSDNILQKMVSNF
jgi:hypothetical protein